MSPADSHLRSPELMSAADTSLLIVDVQEKLIRLVPDAPRIIWNIRRLIDGAKILGLGLLATEQYPQGLGGTVAELVPLFGPIPGKLEFSCLAVGQVAEQLASGSRSKVLLAGIEAHVCIQQTAFDLLAAAYRVYVAVDAVGARHDIDYRTALRRMESGGATLTTTEAALFEWCQAAGTAEFKKISALVRETPPAQPSV